MGVTLSLPGVLYIIIDNLGKLAGNVQSEPQISLFLKLDISKESLANIEKQLKSNPDVSNYHFESKDDAWQELKKNAGASDVAGLLDKNPLPDAYFVNPKSIDPNTINRLQSQMQNWEGVELAQADANWVKRLDTVLKLGKKAILILVVLLAFALIAVIGNTIRLQILTQREEIEVSKLIGATNNFVRRPFLYAGAMYGLGGGIAAWIILVGIIRLFNFSVVEIADLYASNFRLEFPSLTVSIVIILSAISLGWLASFITVNRALSQFEKNTT